MEAFAGQQYEQGKDSGQHPFVNADAAFTMAFSAIMLNTDLHNPQIQDHRRMTLDDFIRNNRHARFRFLGLPSCFELRRRWGVGAVCCLQPCTCGWSKAMPVGFLQPAFFLPPQFKKPVVFRTRDDFCLLPFRLPHQSSRGFPNVLLCFLRGCCCPELHSRLRPPGVEEGIFTLREGQPILGIGGG